MTTPSAYTVTPPLVPAEDRSGAVGSRLLALLSVQAQHGLRWVDEVRRQTGRADAAFAVPGGQGMQWPLHLLYHAATNAYVFAVLARFGEPGRTMGGGTREELIQMAGAMVRAVIETHPVSGTPRANAKWWGKWHTLRTDHLFGMGAWLVWESLAPETRLLVARILEHDADLYNQEQAPALLYDDTQGESNAWTGGGLALACCMLKHHPRREVWADKAKEFMVSAYATERDVTSERVLDGKPLKQWLRSPNAFPDYTVENHGFIHPIYMAAYSEMVRTAICYRLAGEPVPEAATFNAEHVLDALMMMNLPDGNHFYVQGTDYDPRRLDSFLQACNIVPLKPNPLREACFRRVLASMERMHRERPDMHMSGDLTFEFDFGSSWGLTENYLMRRLFGSPAEAVPEEQIEARLAGVHVNELARFAIHRTARSLSSFSWHAIDRASQVMGITLPLDTDVLCATRPVGGYVGEVTLAPESPSLPLKVTAQSVRRRNDGFSVLVELQRCAGRVRQDCAFVSLPDGRSVYFEQRVALESVTLASTESGNVWIYDDLRWPFQKRARVFRAMGGVLQPIPGRRHAGQWLNVDDRLGWIGLGLNAFALERVLDPYQTWRFAFMHPASPEQPQRCAAGETISSFAMVSCPNQQHCDTEIAARDIARRGWLVNRHGVLAIVVRPYLVYANFTDARVPCPAGAASVELDTRCAGWTSL